MDRTKLLARWHKQLIAVNTEMDRQRPFIGERLGVMKKLRDLERQYNKLVAKINASELPLEK